MRPVSVLRVDRDLEIQLLHKIGSRDLETLYVVRVSRNKRGGNCDSKIWWSRIKVV